MTDIEKMEGGEKKKVKLQSKELIFVPVKPSS